MNSIIPYIHLTVYFGSLVTSLLCLRVRTKPAYLRFFFIYPLLAFLITCNSYLQNIPAYSALLPAGLERTLLNISYIFHLGILGWVINQNIPGDFFPVSRKLIYYISLLLVLTIFIMGGFTEKLGLAYGLTNLVLLVLCFIYDYQIFEKNTVHLLEDPGFWIVNGILLGMVVTVPINFSGNYFQERGNQEIILTLKRIGFGGYIIMHLFFIRAGMGVVVMKKKHSYIFRKEIVN